ncbi:hypothetical protein [Vampirovibrio sp.]|uniref:hypothetical protein n=1 Tax=Vampirovibrio sp. TaxID=2717857 RepID=UPI0035931D4A
MSRPKLKLIRGDLSNPDVDQALDAFYAYVLPLMPEEEKLFQKAHQLLIANLIADYAIRNPYLGNFKDEVEEALLPLIKKAMALVSNSIIPE